MKRSSWLVAILVISAIPNLVQTQEQQSSSQAPSQEASQASQPSTVDSQGIRNYLLGPGDMVDVRVFGQPDLNAVVEVDSDGNISSLPFLESPIPARCRTAKEVQ